MARADFYTRIDDSLDGIKREGLWKPERIITSPQNATVTVAGRQAINMCANNYLGLANDPRVVEGAINATRSHGAGLASVRFICGTHDLHKELEASVASYLGFEDAILFAAAFDANGGIFETLLTDKDAVVSDSLNHASIIDGIRLSKAKRYRFSNGDMIALEDQLKAARREGAKTILIVTDGVFSMDGYFADLGAVTQLADRYEALIMVDDCHATGFIGPQGRGTAARSNVEGRVDIVTGTFGKALGGAMGGFIAARRPVIELLRQRARPYLFSNALAPSVCGASLAAITIAASTEGDQLRARLAENAAYFRTAMTDAGFNLLPGEHPIVPVMLHDAVTAQTMAAAMLAEDVLVTAFSYPVVPLGQARIRTQISAAHQRADLEAAVAAFIKSQLKTEQCS